MAGIFDRLQKQIEDKRKEGGITVLDLADLPTALRKIMRLMLRQIQMSYLQLCEATDQMPADERMTRAQLDDALKKLAEQAWLIQIGEGERAIYKVNLRRKPGSKLGESIWESLDAKLKDSPQAPENRLTAIYCIHAPRTPWCLWRHLRPAPHRPFDPGCRGLPAIELGSPAVGAHPALAIQARG